MARAKILAVDDEPLVLKVLVHTLESAGYAVVPATCAAEALALAAREQPDLVVLDLMLPDRDGFEVCRALREAGDFPVLVLSARTAEADKVLGFHAGADDYLTKPFSTTELVLRIQAILRRVGKERPKDEIRLGDLWLHRPSRRVVVDGRPVTLTAKEFEFLWLLASHPYQVFTREQLLDLIWSTNYYGDSQVVTMLVKRLRAKLGDDPDNPRWVKTVRGVGYKLEPERTSALPGETPRY